MKIPPGAARLVVRLVVTFGLLSVLVLVVAAPEEILRLIMGAAPLPLLAAVGLNVLDRVTMAYKWWLLLRARRLPITLWTAVRSYFASSLYGLVLPVTVGADAVRIVALRDAGMMEVTASIIVERGLGVIATGSVALLSCLLLASATTDYALQTLTMWLVIIMTICVGLLIISLLGADRAAARWTRAPALVRRAADAYSAYRRHPYLLVVFYGLSVLESLLSAVVVYIVAAGLGIRLPLWIAVATVPLALAVARLPVSLGGFGVQEAAFVFLAGFVGLPSTQALSVFLLSDAAMLVALLPSVFDGRMLTLRRQVAEDRLV